MLSFTYLPSQLPDEKVVMVMRRDLFIMFKRVASFLLLFGLFFGFGLLLFSVFPDMFSAEYLPLLFLAGSAYLLFVWLFFFFSFVDYYLDVWIITNERIINIEQQGFFSRTVSEQRLFRVQDVTSEVVGFFPTILKYGYVYVQTAAEQQRFAFEEIPNPNEVRDLIIKLAESERERLSKESAAEIKGMM